MDPGFRRDDKQRRYRADACHFQISFVTSGVPVSMR